MAWVLLLLAGAVETSFVYALGNPGSFHRPLPTAVTVATGVLSVYLLSLAMIHLPVGTAYAVWAAIGAAGGIGLSIVVRGEPADPRRLTGLAVIVIGVIVLRLSEA